MKKTKHGRNTKGLFPNDFNAHLIPTYLFPTGLNQGWWGPGKALIW